MNSPARGPFTKVVLEQLLRDPRQTMRQLSAAAGLSLPAVTDRVCRLEDLGIISGYKPVLDHAQLGWNLGAFVSRVARNGRCDRRLDRLFSMSNVIAAYHIAGGTDYLARIAARDLAEMKVFTDALADSASLQARSCLPSPSNAIRSRGEPLGNSAGNSAAKPRPKQAGAERSSRDPPISYCRDRACDVASLT